MKFTLKVLQILPLIFLMGCDLLNDDDDDPAAPMEEVVVSGEGNPPMSDGAVSEPTGPNPTPSPATPDGGSGPDSPANDPTQPVSDFAEPPPPAPIEEGVDTLDTSAIAGLWDYSESISGVIDVIYLEFSDMGDFRIIDYLGDSYDNLDDCYSIELLQVRSLGSDRYYTFDSDGFVVLFSAVVTADGLQVDYDDELIPDMTLPSLAGIDPTFPECSGGVVEDVNDPATPVTIEGNTDTSAIAGLWDISIEFPDIEATDVAYVEISATGDITVWDYFGDDFDQYDDCYASDRAQIRSFANNEFQIFNSDGTASPRFTAFVQNDSLQIISDGEQQSLQRVTSPLNTNFNECVFDDSATPVIDEDVTPVAPPAADGAWTTDTSRIAGVWDTSGLIDGLIDTSYANILADGKLISLDYQGDEYDAGDDCYVIDEYVLEHDGFDNYRFLLDNGEYQYFFAFVANGNELIVQFADGTVDSSFPQFDGTGVTVIECADSVQVAFTKRSSTKGIKNQFIPVEFFFNPPKKRSGKSPL